MYKVVVWWSSYGNKTEKNFAEYGSVMNKFINRCCERDLHCIIEIVDLSEKKPSPRVKIKK